MKFTQRLSVFSLGLLVLTSFGTAYAQATEETPEAMMKTGQAQDPKEAQNRPATPSAQASSSMQKETQCPADIENRRVELYYYRDAAMVVEILNQLSSSGDRLLLKEQGCINVLPSSSNARSGGNVILLSGTRDFNDEAQRIITALDLPLPSIDLQVWGVLLSSKKSNRLATAMPLVRNEIDQTQLALSQTLDLLQGLTQGVFQEIIPLGGTPGVDQKFKEVVESLGYGEAIDGLGGNSILEIGLAGVTVTDPVAFYQSIYNYLFEGEIRDGRFQLQNRHLQPYYEAIRDELNQPPLSNFLHSRGLIYECLNFSPGGELINGEKSCERWMWKAVEDRNTSFQVSNIIRNSDRKVLLEFALHYADYLENPEEYDPGELQRTAERLNEILQETSIALQKDIEALFVRPTLVTINAIADEAKKVTYAQVGRSKISTLNGVAATFNTTSNSAFQVTQPREDIEDLLERASTIRNSIGGETSTLLPREANDIALAAAFAAQQTTQASIISTSRLAFTPSILRDLSSAEIRVNMTLADPRIAATAEDAPSVPEFSRFGERTFSTTVYTRALDFFELSTFTSQATLDGGRWRLPVIGTLWNGVFGAIPVFGDLFSFSSGSQDVQHESLFLTTSFITPTPLGLGNLYTPVAEGNAMFCQRREKVLKYLASPDLEPTGEAARRDTRIISERCSPQEMMMMDSSDSDDMTQLK